LKAWETREKWEPMRTPRKHARNLRNSCTIEGKPSKTCQKPKAKWHNRRQVPENLRKTWGKLHYRRHEKPGKSENQWNPRKHAKNQRKSCTIEGKPSKTCEKTKEEWHYRRHEKPGKVKTDEKLPKTLEKP
jgi:hypothetical protein